jgi:acetyl-CoA C-acetyltransferase/acetyl-CoA acyltransferase
MLDIAIVEGVRTPFAKVFGDLQAIPPHELGRLATVALMERAGVGPGQVDQLVFGNVALPAEAANIARVIALMAGIPQDRIAHTVQRNCASGMEAITTAAQLIQLGEAQTVVAGGTESMSRIPLLYNEEATALFQRLGRAKSWWQRFRTLLKFRPRHFHPVPAVKLGLTDPVSGLIMGETAEVLAEEWNVSREEQDAFALESHRRASATQERCLLGAEIVPVQVGDSRSESATLEEVKQDVGPRKDQSLEALARLKPIFKKGGTVTVGNSCPLTDGAAAVLVMPGETARSQGRPVLGYLRGYAYAGCDPRRMGLGPAYATAKLFRQTRLTLKDVDLVEMNEAFAAQVLANQRAFASDQFARDNLSLDQALGVLDRDRLNVNGGAIALGHPVGATGTRLVITLLRELRRRGRKRGLATLCVGGGQGAALLLEVA